MLALGAQIDRTGRPAINTILHKAFEVDVVIADISKNAYNASSDPINWPEFVPELRKGLAIFDGFDGFCGDQLLVDTTKMDPARYRGLAGLLADDRLYVNTARIVCTSYLAVEGNALGINNTDCGGRALSYLPPG